MNSKEELVKLVFQINVKDLNLTNSLRHGCRTPEAVRHEVGHSRTSVFSMTLVHPWTSTRRAFSLCLLFLLDYALLRELSFGQFAKRKK